MTKKNIVYWITNREYDCPHSDMWINDLYCVEFIESTENSIDMVEDNIKKNSPTHYVIVTDFNGVNRELLGCKFLPNNIIDIKNTTYDKEKVGKQIEWILSDFGMNMKDDDMNIFYTSDTHFFHNNIIKYCNRPWNSGKDENGELIVTEDNVSQMNEDMIKRWNSVVSKDSIVWHLGDFCLGKNQKENIPELVSRLNGKINLVLGNHDHHSVKFYYEAGFNRVYDRKVIINDFVILSHAPMEFVKAPFFNIFGHVHSTDSYKTWSKDSCCVCVERHDYSPVSWNEIKKHYEELNGEVE